MVPVRHFSIIAASILLVGAASAHAGPTTPFQPAVKDGKEFGADFCWQSGGADYRIDAQGKGSRHGAGGSGAEVIALPTEQAEYLEHVWFLPVEQDLLVLFEVTDGNVGRGNLCRYRSSPWQKRWCQWIPAFNLVAARSEDDSVYVGGIGFLGKVDANSGRFLWQQADLYSKDPAFNVFGVPTEAQKTVSFEATDGIGFTPDKRITLARQSGAVLEISELGIGAVSPEGIGLPRTVGECGKK
jgi:hypothetical protein